MKPCALMSLKAFASFAIPPDASRSNGLNAGPNAGSCLKVAHKRTNWLDAEEAQAITIRAATGDDAPALTSIVRACAVQLGHYGSILRGYEVTRLQIERDQIFVAFEGETLQGFYSLSNIDAEPELELLLVGRQFQRTGVGSALFDHMCGRAREIGISRVKIIAHPPAWPFFERMGAMFAAAEAPSGRVTWERHILAFDVIAPG